MVLVIKVNLGSRRWLKVKNNLGVLRLKLIKDLVLKMENLNVSLVEIGTMGNALGVLRFW